MEILHLLIIIKTILLLLLLLLSSLFERKYEFQTPVVFSPHACVFMVRLCIVRVWCVCWEVTHPPCSSAGQGQCTSIKTVEELINKLAAVKGSSMNWKFFARELGLIGEQLHSFPINDRDIQPGILQDVARLVYAITEVNRSNNNCKLHRDRETFLLKKHKTISILSS